jgi:hypothetical protein
MTTVRGLPDSSDAWWYHHDLAETCLLNGKPLTASRHFAHSQRLAAMGPSIMGEIWTRLGVANTQYHLGRPEDALVTIEEADELIHKTKDHQARLGACLHRARVKLDLGDAGAARAAAEAAAALSASAAAVDYVRSLVAYACGDVPEALHCINAALEKDAAAPTPLQLISGILLTVADLEIQREAVAARQGDACGVLARLGPRARGFYPRAVLRALGVLAECAYGEGDAEGAAALYREALALSPGRQEVRERQLLVKAWGAWSPEASQFEKLVRPRRRISPARAR